MITEHPQNATAAADACSVGTAAFPPDHTCLQLHQFHLCIEYPWGVVVAAVVLGVYCSLVVYVCKPIILIIHSSVKPVSVQPLV